MKSIYLSGVVGYEITADGIRSQINEKSTEKLQVIVNSPGGFVIDAFEIFNLFQMYKGEIEFVINGIAASAMSYIIMSGDKISAFKNSIFMAHKAQSIAIGDSDALQTEAEITKAMDNVLAEAYTPKFKKPKEEILSMMKNEIWLIGWEALTEAGIIDNVIDSPEEVEIPDEEIKQQIIFTDSELAKGTEAENRKKAELQIISCMNRMQRDVERITGNRNKAAALLKTESKPEKPVEDKILTEEKMALKDILKTNPEAMAEYEKDLQSAREEGEVKVKAEYSNDRARIAKILELSGVNISQEAITAIEDNIDAGKFAEDELLRQKGKRENKPNSVFAALKAKQTPGEQDPEGAGGASAFDEAKAGAAIKNLFNSRKGD